MIGVILRSFLNVYSKDTKETLDLEAAVEWCSIKNKFKFYFEKFKGTR